MNIININSICGDKSNSLGLNNTLDSGENTLEYLPSNGTYGTQDSKKNQNYDEKNILKVNISSCEPCQQHSKMDNLNI